MRAANRSAPPAQAVRLPGLALQPDSGWQCDVRLGGPGCGAAPSEPIAIVKLPFAGIASEVENSLQELLRSTLNRSGFTVLPAQVVGNRLANESRLFGCSTASCCGRLAQVLGVRRVIEGEVQKLGLEFSLQLWVRDLYTGKLVAPPAKRSVRCAAAKRFARR